MVFQFLFAERTLHYPIFLLLPYVMCSHSRDSQKYLKRILPYMHSRKKTKCSEWHEFSFAPECFRIRSFSQGHYNPKYGLIHLSYVTTLDMLL